MGSSIPLQGESSLTDLHSDGGPIPESLERVEVTSETNLNDILNSEQSEMSDDLPKSIDEFIRDRFAQNSKILARAAGFDERSPGVPMTHTTRNKADVEYAVMLAVLNFQKEFMQSNYSHVQIQLLENLIEVDLTRTSPIPAEAQLAQSQDGQAQLRQMHQALFSAGQGILKKQLEEILGRTINEMVTDLEPLSGKNTIVIRIEEAIDRPS